MWPFRTCTPATGASPCQSPLSHHIIECRFLQHAHALNVDESPHAKVAARRVGLCRKQEPLALPRARVLVLLASTRATITGCSPALPSVRLLWRLHGAGLPQHSHQSPAAWCVPRQLGGVVRATPTQRMPTTVSFWKLWRHPNGTITHIPQPCTSCGLPAVFV